MANRQSTLRDASRLGQWMLRDLGRELRVARLVSGMTQRDVGRALGRSPSRVSRVEHGLARGIGNPQIARHAACVGLKPYLRLYPAVSRPLDRAQLALLTRFRSRLSPSWRVALEVSMPLPGDLRAADVVLSLPGCRCVIEVITRLADAQAQVRSARLKVRDLGADRLVLVVAGTSTNRRAVAEAGPVLRDALPLTTRVALARLGAGQDPGADALVVL